MKKLSLLLLCLLLTAFCAVSCTIPGLGGTEDGGNGEGDGNGNNGGEKIENLIYDASTDLKIIRTEDEVDDTLLLEIMNGLGGVLTDYPDVSYDNSEKSEHEIVIGRTSRKISTDAYTALEKRDAEEGNYRFLIYSDGSSVAIVYDEDSEGAAMKAALGYFVDKYIKAQLVLESGVAYRSQVSLSEYIEMEDERYLEKKWAELEEAAGKDVVSSMKALYAIFGDGVIDWFANLYDPGEGGYYYSNSGRDSQGFLPDIESTSQAIGYLNASGMFQQTGMTSADFFSEEMQAQIIYFIKSRQDADGYFYHPQWLKAHHSTSRLSRDLNWAVGVLNQFGSAPTYDTPRGDRGDGILADGSAIPTTYSRLTSPYYSSVVSAVSRVVSTAAIEERFESRDSFLAYLEKRFGDEGDQPITTNSYVAGNELSSLSNTINQRDLELEALGEPTIAPALIEWLNARQNEFGHWHYELNEDGEYVPKTDYYANNGLLKIANLYNDLGYKMNMIEVAAETAVGAITSKEEVNAIVDIYNTWFCVNCLRRNLVNYGGAEGRTEYESLKARLLELAPDAILVTRDKLAKFLKPDDSFSYLKNASAHLSQNMAVAIPGTNEGDVNATRIAVQTITDMYDSLGLSSHFVPLYTKGDAIRYREILDTLTPFEKPTIEFIEPEVLDSTYLGSGDYKDKAIDYSDVTVTELSELGLIGTNYPDLLLFDTNSGDITAAVNSVNNNKTLEFKNYHYQRDPMLMFNVKDRTLWDKNDSYVFETDFLYEYGTRPEGGDVVQIFLLTSKTNGSSIWYDGSLSIVFNAEEDVYTLNGFGVTDYKLELCRWYNIRLEITDTRSGTASLKLYLNGELIGEKNATTSARQIEAIGIRHRFDVSNGRIFFDNTYFNSINETGEVYVDPNTYIDLPAYERGNGEATAPESFTDKTAGEIKNEGIIGTVNTGKPENEFYGIYFDNYDDSKATQYAKVEALDGDEALEFGSKANGDPYLTFINNTSSDSVVMELDFMIESLTVANGSGNYFVFYPSRKADSYSDISGSAVAINKNAYDEFYIQLGANTSVAKLELNTWYNIRLEMRNISSSPVYTLKVNGVTVAENNLSGSHTLSAIFTRFAWGEKSGKVYIDNYYFGTIEN